MKTEHPDLTETEVEDLEIVILDLYPVYKKLYGLRRGEVPTHIYFNL